MLSNRYLFVLLSVASAADIADSQDNFSEQYDIVQIESRYGKIAVLGLQYIFFIVIKCCTIVSSIPRYVPVRCPFACAQSSLARPFYFNIENQLGNFVINSIVNLGGENAHAFIENVKWQTYFLR